MIDNKYIFDIAMMQSAVDISCSPSDFLKNENVIVRSSVSPERRVYYKEPISCQFVTYGSNVVVSVKEEFEETAREYVDKFTFYHCFETPNVHWLNDKLTAVGQRVCFMAEYYLPDVNKLTPLPCSRELRVLERDDFAHLYIPEWSNALCADRRECDVLAVGAYDGGELVGLAGCSADCREMWQIGIDVLPEYRREGIAAALTSRLACEITERGRVPFYCCAWSNIASNRNAVKSGFIPAWAEMTVKPAEIVNEMNA